MRLSGCIYHRTERLEKSSMQSAPILNAFGQLVIIRLEIADDLNGTAAGQPVETLHVGSRGSSAQGIQESLSIQSNQRPCRDRCPPTELAHRHCNRGRSMD